MASVHACNPLLPRCRLPVVAASAVAPGLLNDPSSRNPARSRRPENVPGEFFVDHTCIDCDTCRWMAPDTFSRVGYQSAVFNQPASPDARTAALQALLSCPTASIRTENPPSDIRSVQETFPLPIDEERLPGIYLCGYHSEKSFGACSYLLTTSNGNIMIDSPRYTERLARRIQAMGGVSSIFLTHKDDVADHAAWKKRFGCDRILHSDDVTSNTTDVEIKLEGPGPWTLGRDIDLIHTPGHSLGSVCLLYKPLGVLFSGDHLFTTRESGGRLQITRRYCYSVSMQLESIRALLPLDFTWVLPGHGRRFACKDIEEKNEAIEELLEAEGAPSRKR